MANCDVIVLSVKPQKLSEVLPEVKKHLRNQHVIVSIATGKNISYLQEIMSVSTLIIRVMQNINALMGASTSCYTASENVTKEQLHSMILLFKRVGSMTKAPEHLFSIFTTICGASPAFTNMYIDALACVVVLEGMPKNMALTKVANAVLGSAKMILQAQQHPWKLVDQVFSLDGTTIQGVTSLQRNHF